jgi:hypothetical protein
MMRGLSAARRNRDLDTGKDTALGEYALADRTYENLVHRLAEHKFNDMNPELRDDLLAFFGDMKNPPRPENKKEQERWEQTGRELQELRCKPCGSAAVAAPPG